MLTLSRKLNEEVKIYSHGEQEITVKVVELQKGKVRLGITAEETVSIYRSELLHGPSGYLGDLRNGLLGRAVDQKKHNGASE